jgi:carbon-monoxide dehydrogenase medium subunit
MKATSFEYTAPTTVEEALTAVGSADDAKFLAGGQSLVPIMNLRMARPDLLIDLNSVGELERLSIGDGTVRIGAMCRHRVLELDDRVRTAVPLLHQAAGLIGHPAIRNRGTLGGTLAHADPAAEMPAAAVALDAQLVLRSPEGARTVGASEFFEGFFMTALEPEELVTEVVVPARRPGTGTAFEEFAPRHGDFALVAIAAVVELEVGACVGIRLAGAGIDSVPLDLSAAGSFLLGETGFAPAAMNELAVRAAGMVQPPADTHASSEDRRELVQLLSIRAVSSAWQRATQPSNGALA